MKKRLISVLLILMLLFSLIPGTAVFAQTADGKPAETEIRQVADTQAEDGPALRVAKTKTVLTFTSDIHNQSTNTAANRLDTWLDHVIDIYGGVDFMGFCGDMGEAGDTSERWWDYVQSVMTVAENKIGSENKVFYTTGNHEFYNGHFASTTNAVATKYLKDKKAIETDDFILYCLGTDNWNSNQDNYTTGQVDTLKAFLATTGKTKPIIILTHFPIHTCSSGAGGYRRTTTNADLVIDALNDAAADRTIVLLWGHNHTMSDAHYDQVFAPGESVEYASGKTKTIQFYHMAAGCMSDSEYGSGSAYVKGKGLVITIDSDRKLDFAYYDANGNNVTEDSNGNGPDIPDDPTPSSSYYEIPEGTYYIKSDDHFYLTTEEGETYTNGSSGSEQYTYYGLKGVSDPESAIRWTFAKADGTNGYYISPVGNAKAANYLNATYVSNDTGGSTGTLKVDETPDVWTIVSNGSGGLILKSSNASASASEAKYLSHGNGGGSSSTDANTFTVRSNNSNNTATTIAYFDQSGNEVAPTAGEGSDTPVDPPTGDTVSITPSTDNPEKSIKINVGDTLSINVTNGSSNSAYDYTATLSKSGVAEIQGSDTVNIATGSTGRFTVKGLAEGTVDVTIQNNSSYGSQYIRKGVVHLTVGEGGQSSGDDPVVIGGGVFEMTNTVVGGKRYVIASANSVGSAYVLSNPGGSSSGTNMGQTAVTIETGNVIKNVASNAIWTATSNGDGFNLTNDGDYLEGKSGEVKIYNSQQYTDRFWTYSGNQLHHTGGQNDYVVYYSSGFTSTYNSTSEKIYFFVESSSEQPPEPPEPAGAFSLSVSGPATAQVGSEVTYKLDLASDDYETFAAADITLTYSTDVLKLTTKPDCAQESNGTITLLDYGADKEIGDGIYSFTFTVEANGSATVKVTSASFIDADGAASGDMIEATLAVPSVTTAVGYTYEDPAYTWTKTDDGNGYTVTALKVCNEDQTQNITETVAAISSETTPATCTEKGERTWMAVFENGAFTNQIRKEEIPAKDHTPGEPERENEIPATCEAGGSYVEVIKCSVCGYEISRETKTSAALGHAWSETEIEWADDYSTATATRRCANDPEHVETETVDTTSDVTTQPTCTQDGKTTYTAVFKNAAFGTQTKDIVNVPATGHEWNPAGYYWSDDNLSALAMHQCSVCGDSESETVETNAVVTTLATCEEMGWTTYIAEFTKAGFETQTRRVKNVPALEHDWGEPKYEWAADNTSVTATRICANDKEHDHVQMETVSTTSEVTKPATCETAGEVTYTAVFKNEAFVTQTKVIEEIDATGHDWSEPSYSWALDYSKVTAVRRCSHNKAHIDFEEAQTNSVVTKEATCTEKGETTYTAVFENEVFTTQTVVVADIPALGHVWGDPEWIWAEDYSSATVTYTCINDKDEDHVYTAEAEVSSETVEPTPVDAGSITYTATAKNPSGKTVTDIKEVPIPPAGYTYREPEYKWIPVGDGYMVIAESMCNEDPDQSITDVADATYAVTTEPGCETVGEGTWTAVFKKTVFATQTRLEEIPAVGHNWSEASYKWSEDNHTVTATRTCANDEAHVETETVETTSEITKDAVCEENGETTYTAEFENTEFKTQKKTVEDIEATGHVPGEPVIENVVPPTEDAEGSHDEVIYCAVCGKELSRVEIKDEYVEPAKPKIKSAAVVLSGQIGMNFYLELPEIDGVNYSESYMEFTIGGRGPVKDTVLKTDKDGNRYFTCYVNSVEMAEKIQASFYYGKEKPVKASISVKDYIQYVVDHPSLFNAKSVALVKAIADYGHYAQIFLAAANHWTVGKEYANMDLYYTTSYNYGQIIAEMDAQAKVTKNEEMIGAGQTLHLDAETTMDIILYAAPGKTLDGVEMTMTIHSQEENKDTVKTVVPVKQADGSYLIQVTGISAHQLDDKYTITGETASGEFMVKVSALTYARTILNNKNGKFTEKDQDGAASLYGYYVATMDYREH